MLKVKFFHLPKNKQFNYIPRYYNPEEEERHEKLRKLNGENQPGDSIKGAFVTRRMQQRKTSKVSTIRAIIIIAILALIVYWLIYGQVPFL